MLIHLVSLNIIGEGKENPPCRLLGFKPDLWFDSSPAPAAIEAFSDLPQIDSLACGPSSQSMSGCANISFGVKTAHEPLSITIILFQGSFFKEFKVISFPVFCRDTSHHSPTNLFIPWAIPQCPICRKTHNTNQCFSVCGIYWNMTYLSEERCEKQRGSTVMNYVLSNPDNTFLSHLSSSVHQ